MFVPVQRWSQWLSRHGGVPDKSFLAAASANAAILRMTAVPALLVVRPDSNDGLTQLRSAGAWLTIDPRAIAACFKTNADENDLRR
jgi:hypothetical protein